MTSRISIILGFPFSSLKSSSKSREKRERLWRERIDGEEDEGSERGDGDGLSNKEGERRESAIAIAIRFMKNSFSASNESKGGVKQFHFTIKRDHRDDFGLKRIKEASKSRIFSSSP
jgi:hypothetical protein